MENRREVGKLNSEQGSKLGVEMLRITKNVIGISLLVVALPGLTEAQTWLGRDVSPIKISTMQSTSVVPINLSLEGRAAFLRSLHEILKERLGADQAKAALAAFEGSDTGAVASSYGELVGMLPTSAETILRNFRRIAAVENVSTARLSRDILSQVAFGPRIKPTKSTQTVPVIAGLTGGGASIAVALGLGALGLAAAGGGSGSSGSSCGTICAGFLTEYNMQYGLGLISASDLNDGGFTGAGVNIAVNDSGIDASHSEFNGRTINGVDFTGITGTPNTDENGHGTHVASTIGANRDQMGMRGVAYDANLFSYKIGNAAGSIVAVNSDASWANIIARHVIDGIDISNNSWGSSATIDTVSAAAINGGLPLSLAAFANAQTSGTIFVWANGNAGQANPGIEAGLATRITSLAPQWLSVTAIGSDKVETNYTNRCGISWDTCVTAPGGGDDETNDGIYAARSGGGYVRLSGTSMAAPHVSGLLALVATQFPSLTPAQVVARVKATASYDGLTGRNGCTSATCTVNQMREIFGHGLINQQAAVAVVGGLTLATSSEATGGGSVSLAAKGLSMPAGLGAATISAIGETQVAVFDSFDGAAFAISGAGLFSAGSSLGGSIGYTSSAAGSIAGGDRFLSYAVLSEGLGGATVLMSQASTGTNVASLSVWGDKASLLPTPAFLKAESTRRIELLTSGDNGISFMPYVQLGNADGDAGGFGMNMVFDLGKSTKIMASLGRSNAAFEFDLTGTSGDLRSEMDNIELGFSHEVSNTLEVFGRYSKGFTEGFAASTTNWGLSNASFSRAAFGMELKGTKGARFAFGMANPGNFNSGQVSLLAASGRSAGGAVLFSQRSFNAASETSFAPFFAAKLPVDLGRKFPGQFTFAVQQDPSDIGKIARADLSLSLRF